MKAGDFTDTVFELVNTGYRERAEDIDYEVAANGSCECGAHGLDLRGFQRRVDGELVSYRAFAVCPRCGNAYEF